MIDTQTVTFIGCLNYLARESKHGIRPFSTARVQDKKGLWYDDKNPIRTKKACSSYPLVCSYLINDLHHDIISTWTEEEIKDGIQFDVAIMNDEYLKDNFALDTDGMNDKPFVHVKSKNNRDLCIIIQDGVWYAY